MAANVSAQQLKVAQAKGQSSWANLVAYQQGQIDKARLYLANWYKSQGIETKVEGWFPIMVKGRPSTTFGEWRTLTAAQQVQEIWQGDDQASELTYPMFALVPDVREPDHLTSTDAALECPRSVTLSVYRLRSRIVGNSDRTA